MGFKQRFFFVALMLLSFAGCSSVQLPKGVTPVKPFDVNRYVGRWYEIARLDHAFERGLTDVTATYSIHQNGYIQVKNRGFDPIKQRWREAEGKAYFVRNSDEGYLKVSFFGPFYGTYAVAALDMDQYQHAWVVGPNLEYLWILARTPTLDSVVLNELLVKAKSLGFNADALIYVAHQTGGIKSEQKIQP